MRFHYVALSLNSLIYPNRPFTHDPPTSGSLVPGLQACATTPTQRITTVEKPCRCQHNKQWGSMESGPHLMGLQPKEECIISVILTKFCLNLTVRKTQTESYCKWPAIIKTAKVEKVKENLKTWLKQHCKIKYSHPDTGFQTESFCCNKMTTAADKTQSSKGQMTVSHQC